MDQALADAHACSNACASACPLTRQAGVKERVTGGHQQPGAVVPERHGPVGVTDDSHQSLDEGHRSIARRRPAPVTSVMGRSELIPRFHLAAGYLLPSVVGARAAT